MSGMSVVRGTAVEEALAQEPRQYLMGRLGRPQALEHVASQAAEIGIVDYPCNTAEPPHVHPLNGEYVYVVRGASRMMDLDTGTVTVLRAGDLCVLPAGVPHAQNSQAGTRLLFFKAPGGNDKTLLDVDAELRAWLEDYDY